MKIGSYIILRASILDADRRKAEIAFDTLERISRAVYKSRPHPTDVRGILEAGRIKMRMVDDPSGCFPPPVSPAKMVVGKSHTAQMASLPL
jgi:hypothetical protein